MSRDRRYVALINTARWRRVRGLVLSAQPLCEVCRRAGRVTAATEVHHIRPLESIRDPREMERLAYDRHNLMPLCHDCHVQEHRIMRKGTRQERRARAQGDADAFAARWLRPGADF